MWMIKNSNNVEMCFHKKPVASFYVNGRTGQEQTDWVYPSYRLGEESEEEDQYGDIASFNEEYLWDNWGTSAKVIMPEGSMEKLLGFKPEINTPYELV